MNRRDLLKGVLGSIGSALLPPFLRPLGATRWGAIVGGLATHQFIVKKAMTLLAQDPLAEYFRIPSASQIIDQDYVILQTALLGPDLSGPGLRGPGPDVPGNSPYSWHYFNPVTRQGLAPEKVGDLFEEMMAHRLRDEDQAKATAWSAHFLADMFVPYHTLGCFAEDVDLWRRGYRWILDEDICGDWELMYSRSGYPPPGGGWNFDHTDDVRVFRSAKGGDHGKELDWFDPWYWNGYLGWPIRDASGSHQAWEFFAGQGVDSQAFLELHDHVQAQSWYDPLWVNQKAAFVPTFYANQAAAARAFAEACARRTRQETELIMANPNRGITMAIRAVLTLYRASMTSVGLSVRQEPLPRGGRAVIATVQNRHPWSPVQELDLKLTINTESGANSHVSRIAGGLAPGRVATNTWNVSTDRSGVGRVEAAGVFSLAPDLGYSSVNFQVDSSPSPRPQREREEPTRPEARPEEVSPRGGLRWEGEWLTEYQWGQDWGWNAHDKPLRIRFRGNEMILERGGNSISGSLAEGGRCFTASFSDGGGMVFMQGCLDPSGDSFQGFSEMRTSGETVRQRIRGRRDH